MRCGEADDCRNFYNKQSLRLKAVLDEGCFGKIVDIFYYHKTVISHYKIYK